MEYQEYTKISKTVDKQKLKKLENIRNLNIEPYPHIYKQEIHAADLIKIAMIQVYNALKEGKYKAKIVSQIHDEIILKVDDDEKDEVLNLVKSIMENCVQLNVKLKVDGGSAKTWYDAK